jgi:hypothetical protein
LITTLPRRVDATSLNKMPFSPSTPRTPSSNSSQWLFTKSELLASPSIRDGLDPQTEKGNRSKGCQFIETVGRNLRLHQPTIATAAMFFHRFYMRQPFSRFHQYVLSKKYLVTDFVGCCSDVCISSNKSRGESTETTRFDNGCCTI